MYVVTTPVTIIFLHYVKLQAQNKSTSLQLIALKDETVALIGELEQEVEDHRAGEIQ